MKTIRDYREEATKIVRDGANIIAPERYDALIAHALEQYSKKVSLSKAIDLTSTGSADFALSSLTGYDEVISGEPAIEYPIAVSGDPNFIDRRYWIFVNLPTGRAIRLLGVTPPSGANVRFTFNTLHTITPAASTVRESDFYAICNLVAAEACEELALYYTQTNEGGLSGSDISITPAKAQEFAARARDLRKKFDQHVGAGADDGPGAASVTANWDVQFAPGLTHPRRLR